MAEKVPADPRVTALGLIIKLTDDVFKAPDFDSAASLIVNSSHSLLRFKSAVLVELGREKNQVIAQYGQTELYPHTEQAQLQKAVAQSIDFSENNTLLLTKESLSDMEGKGADALAQLLDGDDPILVYKMAPQLSSAIRDSISSGCWSFQEISRIMPKIHQASLHAILLRLFFPGAAAARQENSEAPNGTNGSSAASSPWRCSSSCLFPCVSGSMPSLS